MKRVRILLRVSSNQQLEADGDLSVQRQLVKEYVKQQEDWILDEKEYFEGSSSGYKNAVMKREALQEALEDARNQEYDILAVYKDDRVGRRMWEMGAYIMALKGFGVDIYTVKDGCISPDMDDIMGQMMLALRYGNAQKSSSDTGMRVKDTAQKLVQKGKFMGGKAPYGYELVLSGELSKHGRALHVLKINSEQAEVVKHIYALSLNKEYGSLKIAKVLNKDGYYKRMAPRDVWKEGTVTSILTNPVYAGFAAYKRRERVNGRYHRLDSEEWIKADMPNEDIKIIEEETWNLVQEKRKKRAQKYRKKQTGEETTVIKRNDGILPLIDVLYCGYCKGKLINGTRYNYWTLQGNKERRSSRTPIYKCQNAGQGLLHDPVKQFHADWVEKIVFQCLAEYIGRLQAKEEIVTEVLAQRLKRKRRMEAELKKEKEELGKLKKEIEIMESHVPSAMTGDDAFTEEELVSLIRKYRKKEKELQMIVLEREERLKSMDLTAGEKEKLEKGLPTWQQIFWEMAPDAKRVLIQKMIEKVEVTRERVVIYFRIGLAEFQP